MFTLLLLITILTLSVVEGFFIFTLVRRLSNLEKVVLRLDTPVTLSTVEIEEAGLAALIRDLTEYKAKKGENGGVEFFEINLPDLLQVITQKLRQLNIENDHLAAEVFSDNKK